MRESFDEMLDAMRKNLKHCGWTKERTVEGYVDEIISEANELKEAIEKKDYENLKEEIGDLLWDTFTLALIAERDGLFNAKDSVKSIVEKIKRRKPQIFTGENLTREEALERWKKAKEEEKNDLQ